MPIALAPFRQADMWELLRGVRNPLGLPMEFIAQVYEERGVAFTARDDDGQIIGAAGLVFEGPGMAHAWVMLWPLLETRQRLFVARTLRQWLPDMAALHGLRRVQTYVAAAEPSHLDLIEWLGFEPEGIARHYGPQDETYIAFAWFPGEAKGEGYGASHPNHRRRRDDRRRRRDGLQPSAAGAHGEQGGGV